MPESHPVTVSQTPDRALGWEVREEQGRLVATRPVPLSDYQEAHGCVSELRADSAAELSLLCQAQELYGQLVAQAEMALVADQLQRKARLPWRRDR